MRGVGTSAVPVMERARAEKWRELLGSTFGRLKPEQIDAPSSSSWSVQDLDGEITVARLGRADAFRVTGSPQIVRRTARAIAHSPADPLKICIQQTGRAVVHQSGREVAIGPGELALYDTGRPYDLRLESDWTCAVMTFPRDALGMPDTVISDAMQHPFRVDSGPGAVLAHLLSSAWATPRGCRNEVAAERLGEAGVQLMASLVSTDSPGRAETGMTAAEEVMRTRVLEYVRTHLAELELTHASVAAAHHMSVRTLQRLFEQEPQSVAEVIRSLRLEAIRQELLDPRRARHPVMVLASHWGYNEQSHFTRAFKGHYGVTPAALRKAHQNPDG
jgi:AraC-like DNA-binding protein